MASLGRSKEKTILFVAIGVVLVSVITISIVGVSKAKARKAAAEKAIAEQEAAERAAAAEKEAAEKAEAAAKAAAEYVPQWHTISSETIYIPVSETIYHRFYIPCYSKIYVQARSSGNTVNYRLYFGDENGYITTDPVVGSVVESSEEYEFQSDFPEGTHYLYMHHERGKVTTTQGKVDFLIQAWY